MVKIENDCVDCGMPCLGSACPYTHVKHFYCDSCGADCDPDDLYLMENGDLICRDCLEEYLLDQGTIERISADYDGN